MIDNVHPSWQPLFEEKLNINFDMLYDSSVPVYPPQKDIFRAFTLPVDSIRIVLLGQDPYHAEGQAMGLSFSVPSGVRIPPSLKNIFKELLRDYPERGYTFTHGCLDVWSNREKIFLLNSALTVFEANPGSHLGLWQEWTDEVIRYLAAKNPRCVFILLGAFAKSKASLIGDSKRVVSAPHPSPMARGFIGSGVFRKAEAALGETIDWSLADEH